MKKSIFIFAALLSLCASANAQEITTINTCGTPCTTTTIEHMQLEQIHSTLPVALTITAESSDTITIEYPETVEPYIKFEINREMLCISERDESVTRRQLLQLGSLQRINIRVPSSCINYVANFSDMTIEFENERCAKSLEIVNAGTMYINGKAITADAKIDITNFGSLLSMVGRYTTTTLSITNSGQLSIVGEISATLVEHNTMGVENSDINVKCHQLDITTFGSGILRYSGTADSFNISHLGDGQVVTSGLNVE